MHDISSKIVDLVVIKIPKYKAIAMALLPTKAK